VRYRYRDTTYSITVRQSAGARTQATVTVDGTEQADGVVHLLDDHAEHIVDVLIPGGAS
jgi:cyclic beta-1,2-glucan synthetase